VTVSSVEAVLSDAGADSSTVTGMAADQERHKKVLPIDYAASLHVALDSGVVPPAEERLLHQTLTGLACNYYSQHSHSFDAAEQS